MDKRRTGEQCGGVTARLTETHTATLRFEDGLVRKRKKPLDLGFLDFSSVEARRQACEAEVRLNARMAPDVYLGVEPVRDADGAVVDHEVLMRWLPAERSLTSLVQAGADVRAPLQAVARQLATLHARSAVGPELRLLGSADWQRQLWDSGLDALRPFDMLVPDEDREAARSLAQAWLAGREPLLASRLEAGRLVDGHGDLQADDVFVLDDGPRVLDCLEFDDRLRIVDGVADACFLVMDLERLGAPAAAATFLDAYLAAAVDAVPPSFVHHHVAYRAHVRCKVACIRAAQAPTDDAVQRARELSALSLEHLRLGTVRLVLVGGLPGSGKTTVATSLARRPGVEHLSSDHVRKHLAGLPPEVPAGTGPGEGLYDEAMTARTYESLLDEARTLLGHGRSVVLDATFADERWRETARALGRSTSSQVVELRCTLDPGLADERLLARRGGASDATPAVRAWLAERAAPWPEAVEIDTSGDLDATLARAAAQLDIGRAQRPSALTNP